jgi:hypothetical protein
VHLSDALATRHVHTSGGGCNGGARSALKERRGESHVATRNLDAHLGCYCAVLVVAPAVESKTVTCKSGQVCKGTNAADWIFGSPGNDNIRPMGGNDYVFGNDGADEVAHSYGDDRIFGGCGSDTVRGGFGLDIIYANRPKGLYPPETTCVSITAPLTAEQSTALEQVEEDVPDRAHDLVDCAWIASRGDPEPDKGFGSAEKGDIPDVRDDTVVDCSNRDDQ